MCCAVVKTEIGGQVQSNVVQLLLVFGWPISPFRFNPLVLVLSKNGSFVQFELLVVTSFGVEFLRLVSMNFDDVNENRSSPYFRSNSTTSSSELFVEFDELVIGFGGRNCGVQCG